MLDENNIVSKSGNALKYTSIVTNGQHFFQRSTTDPISTFDANAKTGLIALASTSTNPDIQIILYPDGVSKDPIFITNLELMVI